MGGSVTNSAGDPTRNLFSGITIELLAATGSGAEPTTPGGPVTERVADGDGTTTLFTTTQAYAPTSLKVFMNGIDITDSVSETDSTAGTFTISPAPRLGAEIEVRYVAA